MKLRTPRLDCTSWIVFGKESENKILVITACVLRVVHSSEQKVFVQSQNQHSLSVTWRYFPVTSGISPTVVQDTVDGS